MYPLEDDALARAIGEGLVARGAQLAVVETTAGGLISARLVSAPGASRWFERGVVAYTRRAKLDVSADAEAVMATHGAVSPELVSHLAERVRDLGGAAYGMAESGIAGPQDGRHSVKPVGTTVIAVACPDRTVVESHVFPGGRVEVMSAIAQRSLELLRELLEA